MPTPANRAKIQLVRGSYSNINASLADLVDGELCYAKDENRLYMVEGSTLTPVVAEDDEVLVEVHNQSGSDIAKGKPVYVSGTHSSGKPIVDLTDSNGTNTYPAIGLVYETIANGADGKVIVSGLLSNISTNALGNAGDALYISSTVGGLTTTRPTAATEQVQKVGLITRSHASNGSVLVIGAGRTNDVPNEIAVSNLANGTARQLLQTDAAGTGVEFTSNVDVPGTLDVTSAATFDSNVTIEGDLTVNGTTTTIDTTTLIVEDKNIEMGSVSTPSDVTADGGGITLKGATDKTINWVNATGCWTFNQPTNFNNHVRIDSSGNVLLGGTLPSAPAIELKADGSGEFAKQVIVGENTDAAGGTFIGVDGYINLKRPSSSQGGFPLFLGKLGGTETSKITADGSITAAGNLTIGDKIIHNGDTNTAVRFPANDTVSVETAGSERLRIDSSGNVGIGTTSPGALLHIKASAPVFRTEDNNGSVDYTTDTNGGAVIRTNQASPLRLFTDNTERARIDSSGNVFIGGSTAATADIALNANGSATFAGDVNIGGKARSTSTVSGDVGTTLTTKDYLDLFTPRTSATGSSNLSVGTTAQRDGSPAAGMIRYNSTLGQFEGYGSAWGAIGGGGGGATGGGSDKWAVEHDNTITTDYTIGTGKNVISAGPLTVNSTATVTIPSGSTWVIA